MSRSARGGVSLIEVLVVVAIIAVLVAMLFPATRRVRVAAARMSCSNNLKQLMIAFLSYSDAHPGPPTAGAPDGNTSALGNHLLPPGCFGPGAAPDDRLSWAVALLPYLEQDDLHKRFDREKGYAGNLAHAQRQIKPFVCPVWNGEPGDVVTHYVVLAGVGRDAAARPAGAPGNGFLGFDRVTTWQAFADGTSNTIALMETRADLGPWARGGAATVRGFDPDDAPAVGDQRPFGGHPKMAQAAMADGSVRSLSSSIDARKLAAAITIAGGESVNLD
jgi:prepilin-type N-terminal cleavage/methylation domain-containing protein